MTGEQKIRMREYMQEIVQIEEVLTVGGKDFDRVNELLSQGWKLMRGCACPMGGCRADGTPTLLYCLYLTRGAQIQLGKSSASSDSGNSEASPSGPNQPSE